MNTCFPSGHSTAQQIEEKAPDQGSIVIPETADEAFQFRERQRPRQDRQPEERRISVADQTDGKVLCNRCSPIEMKPNAAKAGDEAVLVHRVQAGDELAFRQLVERYQSKVFCIIRGILGKRNEVEDIAQQVLSEEERSLIMLKEVEGCSIEELAAMTGLNENTIKVRLFRVRQKLLKVAHQFRSIQPAGVRSTHGC